MLGNDMTGKQYRAIRERLGLTQAQLAEQLGITTKTIQRRELEQWPINKEGELAIKWLAEEMR